MDGDAKKPTNKDILEEMEMDTDAGAIQEEIDEEEDEKRQRDRVALGEKRWKP